MDLPSVYLLAASRWLALTSRDGWAQQAEFLAFVKSRLYVVRRRKAGVASALLLDYHTTHAVNRSLPWGDHGPFLNQLHRNAGKRCDAATDNLRPGADRI